MCYLHRNLIVQRLPHSTNLMKQVNSQKLFATNQELATISATDENVSMKVECFHITPEDVASFQKDTMSPTPFPGSFTNSIDSGFTNPVYGLNPYATSRHFPALKAAFASSFPDFDFSHLCPWHFKLISSAEQASYSITIFITSHFPETENVARHVWQAIDNEMNASISDIYQYDPDCPDAFTEMGVTSNLSLFFINEQSDRVLIFHAREGVKSFDSESDGEEGESLEDRYGYGLF